MPIAAAMRRFWVTARIRKPSGVKRSTAISAEQHGDGEHDDGHAIIGEGHLAEAAGAAHPGRGADFSVRSARTGSARPVAARGRGRRWRARFRGGGRRGSGSGRARSTMPSAPEARKASGMAMNRLAPNRPGAWARIDLLHHERHVGTDHHHLAMGHVDDPHDAEGDRQARCRQKQHGAEAEAVEARLAARLQS